MTPTTPIPSSVRAAIEVLAALSGRKWLVLGDMGELGAFATEAHTDIGEFARARGSSACTPPGALMQRAVESFGAGAPLVSATAAELTAALSEALRGAGPEVRLLVKGSRSNRLERVVDGAHRRPRQDERALVLYWLTQQFAGHIERPARLSAT